MSSTLLKVMDKKSCGYLEPVITKDGDSFTPLIVIMTQNSSGHNILAAFCVDNDCDDKQVVRENFISYLFKLVLLAGP